MDKYDRIINRQASKTAYTVVFFGGCPYDIKPDRFVKIAQVEPTKWQRVRNLLVNMCNDEELAKDFWLFNDDFFVMKPMPEDMAPQYNGILQDHIKKIEERHNRQTPYTEQLRRLVKTLEYNGLDCLNYAIHKPIRYNKQKLKEVLDKFPDEPMVRSLYGNYWEIGGENSKDVKTISTDIDNLYETIKDWDFISTYDNSFRFGNIGEYLRNEFNEKTRFEK